MLKFLKSMCEVCLENAQLKKRRTFSSSCFMHILHIPGPMLPLFYKFDQAKFLSFHTSHIKIIILMCTFSFHMFLNQQSLVWPVCCFTNSMYVSAIFTCPFLRVPPPPPNWCNPQIGYGRNLFVSYYLGSFPMPPNHFPLTPILRPRATSDIPSANYVLLDKNRRCSFHWFCCTNPSL